MASGIPSKRRQISATIGAFSSVSLKRWSTALGTIDEELPTASDSRISDGQPVGRVHPRPTVRDWSRGSERAGSCQ